MKRIFGILAAALVCLAVSCSKEPNAKKCCFVYAETLKPIEDEYICQFGGVYKPSFVAYDGKSVLPDNGNTNYVTIELLDDSSKFFANAAYSAEKYGIEGWCFGFGAKSETRPGQTGSARLIYDDGSLHFEKTVTLIADNPYITPVDLGLSVNWAQCNLGALTPQDSGDFYPWAGTEYFYQDGYALEDPQDHWKLGKASGYTYTTCPYQGNSGAYDDITVTWYKYDKSGSILEKMDDAASVVLGDNWRMPTNKELKELKEYCKWTWTTMNGVKGYKVQSKMSGYTDNWIFLPACGIRYGTKFGDFGIAGNYWSSSLENYSDAYCLYFDSSKIFPESSRFRIQGLTIRPVSEK